MNLFECGALTLGLAGAGAGMVLGYKWVGPLGIPVGGVLGLVCGLVMGGGATMGLFWGATLLERLSKRRGLSPAFGRYWVRRRTPGWVELTQRLTPGTSVRGRVVRVYYYGCFVDIGVGFPALLKAVDNGRLVSQLPALHAEIDAFVFNLDALEREVVISSEERWWLTRDGVTALYLLGNPPFNADGEAAWAALTLDAHQAFRAQLERGAPMPCQLRPPRGSARQVLVEQAASGLIRILDVEGGRVLRGLSDFDDETMKRP